MAFVQLDGVQQILAEVDFSTFENFNMSLPVPSLTFTSTFG